ncbi:hypothetical protein HELRODRAFT_177175 [Helobdella robusta]|uniref:Uncharacterized protein n=1 Tax=Helobdella robusta TaxID=6412 RepID=T1FBB6_HELRO|nr:hypothetical protein HELRODRAFT_177175 [Helobdella robusta]ESN98293.1 hypothetical protein HELRODRAFT_177175 [Helobdella robusta]
MHSNTPTHALQHSNTCTPTLQHMHSNTPTHALQHSNTCTSKHMHYNTKTHALQHVHFNTCTLTLQHTCQETHKYIVYTVSTSPFSNASIGIDEYVKERSDLKCSVRKKYTHGHTFKNNLTSIHCRHTLISPEATIQSSALTDVAE